MDLRMEPKPTKPWRPTADLQPFDMRPGPVHCQAVRADDTRCDSTSNLGWDDDPRWGADSILLCGRHRANHPAKVRDVLPDPALLAAWEARNPEWAARTACPSVRAAPISSREGA